MTADHEAQRQAADSQATNQGALDVVALALDEAEDALHYVALNADEQYRFMAQRVLSALAEAGYTVVKTEALEVLYADLLGAFAKPREDTAQAFLNGYRRCLMEVIPSYMPGVSPDGRSVPEGSAEEAGGA